MSAKQLEVTGLGTVRIYKHKKARSIKITVSSRNYIRVSMPTWLPYRAGLEYVKSKSDWIDEHRRQATLLKNGTRVGKAHELTFIPLKDVQTPFGRLTATQIKISYPNAFSVYSPEIQSIAHKFCVKALRQEANTLLPQRIEQLSKKHDFSYQSVRVRVLRSRWGSCTHKQDISLSIFLMQLPWQLIDYVLLHELTHTKFLNHSSKFWQHMEQILPGYDQHKKSLKLYQPVL